MEEDEWLAELDEKLPPLVEAQDVAGVRGWLESHFPREMARIPPRRRVPYVEGFTAGVLVDRWRRRRPEM
jgi:hypothetical protein